MQGDPVEDPETATTVRVRNGEVLLSDGPFAETKEIVAGYDLLEAPDLDTAIDYASRHPVAAIGSLEVRAGLGRLLRTAASGRRSRAAPTGSTTCSCTCRSRT